LFEPLQRDNNPTVPSIPDKQIGPVTQGQKWYPAFPKEAKQLSQLLPILREDQDVRRPPHPHGRITAQRFIKEDGARNTGCQLLFERSIKRHGIF
jgi:hypothetical protein